MVASSSSDEDNSFTNQDIQSPQPVNQYTSSTEGDKKDRPASGLTQGTSKNLTGETDSDVVSQASTAHDNSCSKKGYTTSQAQSTESRLSPQDSNSSDDTDSEGSIIASKRRKSGTELSILRSDDESGCENNNTSPERKGADIERLQRSNNLKEKQKSLFSDFKDAVKRRKSRSSVSDSK
ncbi:hypothetical protein ElyMa_005234200 [Elysia marginata]|uniref:Uncharacterized protein n=1 Tax=Elysia marginata TaxID=1093978 RepID=A0AAV4JXM1_9GAST|nr:hypothetical protein ElyMa_005234200 [Elysia marginata]